MPSSRLPFALFLSAVLHLAAFGIGDRICHTQHMHRLPATAKLEATLRVPLPEPIPEPLLKDTLADRAAIPAAPKAPADKSSVASLIKRAAQQKLAEHIYYPQEAVAAGLEGDVQLLLTLDANGGIRDVQLAAGSGHAILDQAAVRAAHAMGSLPGFKQREIMLPVTFRLQP